MAARVNPAPLGGQWRIAEGQYPSSVDSNCLLLQHRSGTAWITVAALAPDGSLTPKQSSGITTGTTPPPGPTASDEGTFYYYKPGGATSVLYFCIATSPGTLEWISVGISSS